MKMRSLFGLVLVCALATLAITPGATTLAAAPTIVPGAASGPLPGTTAITGCFPVDECNICCTRPGGGLICTQRACV